LVMLHNMNPLRPFLSSCCILLEASEDQRT
jgi:hypothetical protein